MNIRDEVRRLIASVRDLEDRVRDLESEPADEIEWEVGADLIGFEIDEQDEFDEDASEFRK